jgi:hypothetical protein
MISVSIDADWRRFEIAWLNPRKYQKKANPDDPIEPNAFRGRYVMLVFLRVILSLVLLIMIGLTLVAFQEAGLMEAGSELWKDAWFRLTLADAYFGFLIVYLWVAYKERTWWAKIVWFVLFMALGNMAVATYILIQLFKVREDNLASSLLLRADE